MKVHLGAAALSSSFRTILHVNANSTAPALQQEARKCFLLCVTMGRRGNRESNYLACLVESPEVKLPSQSPRHLCSYPGKDENSNRLPTSDLPRH